MSWLPKSTFDKLRSAALALSREQRKAMTWNEAAIYIAADTLELAQFDGLRTRANCTPWNAVCIVRGIRRDEGTRTMSIKEVALDMKRRCEVSRKAKEIKQKLIDEAFQEAGITSEQDIKHAWTILFNEVVGRDDADTRSGFTPMSYEEARRYYHNHEITFGKFKGNKLDEVPTSYLKWLNDQPDFRRDLFRFMESPFAKSQAMINEHVDNRQDDEAGFDSPPGY